MRNNTIASGEPVYVQIVIDIRLDIFSGMIKPGELIPSEASLVSKYGVSRETVRKSLKELEHQGFIYARPGKGYFVAKPEHDQFILNFSDEDERLISKIHRINVVSSDAEVESALNLLSSKSIVKITRISMLSDTPVAYELRYIPYDKGMPVIESDIKYAVFPDIAAAKTTPFAFHTEMKIGAEFGDSEVQKALKCGPKDPLLVVYRYFIDQDSVTIAYGKKYIRSEFGCLQAVSGYKL